MNHDRITIYVGKEQFITTRGTLANGMREGSKYFVHLFRFEDATRFVENGMSKRTARRSGVMPLLWTEDQGFDYVAYARLEKMADFLVIERLRRWVSEKKYLRVVEYVHHASRQTLRSAAYTGRSSSKPATWSTKCKGNVACTVSPELNSTNHHRDGDITIITREVVINNKILFDEE